MEAPAALDDRAVAVEDVDRGAHPAELAHPLEAVLEDGLTDVRCALCLCEQHRGRRLEVGCETRIRSGFDVDGREAPAVEGGPVDLDRVLVARDTDAGA